jgi:Xaa-Pro aminopeptidase
VRKQLKIRQLDAFLVSSTNNRYYLTGWCGDEESGFCLIAPKRSLIITDSRYTEHASQVTGFKIIETDEGIGPALRDIARYHKLSSIGFESHDLSVFFHKRIRKYLKGVKLIPVAHLVEELRSDKDDLEISFIKKATGIAGKAFDHALGFIKPDLTEAEVAWEVEKYMRGVGADGVAWSPFIVSTRPNSSIAHWGASNKKIEKGDMVQLDYGCSWRGYVCDISRVVFVGKPDDKKTKIYNLVLEAQKLGLNLVKEGARGQTIDKEVGSFLEKHTKHRYRHALGHGVGLNVHELPYANVRRKSKLAAGNVITIEPGIYIPGWGGVRIEDTVLVTKEGHQTLTKAPKRLSKVTI